MRLPVLEATILMNRLQGDGLQKDIPSAHRQLSYEVQQTDNFSQLCIDLKCRPESIAHWNGLQN